MASKSDLDASTSCPPPEPPSQVPAGFVMEELAADDSSDGWEDQPSYAAQVMSSGSRAAGPIIPDLFTTFPPIKDALVTQTSEVQDEIIDECLPYLAGDSEEFLSYNCHGIPHLARASHIRFLHRSLQGLPSGYVAADAARPWFFYWALCGLSTLGEDVSSYRESLISTVRPMQNVTGGFGGGHGQMSHLAPTYAIVLSLALVGGDEALEVIDRKAMWSWLGAIKQADGGFQMFIGGEEDVRGTYCAAVIISLLNLPVDLPNDSTAKSCDTDNLLTRIPEYVSKCQTYEGGISSCPGAEAHGAYAFCGLACLSILGEPHVIIPKYLNLPRLISWLSARQYAPEGGFSGRTNKLVDGCYAHWVGGCWPLVMAALRPPQGPKMSGQGSETGDASKFRSQKTLYSREGLIRYILCVCQDTSRRGGLRDKPSKNSDGYHTNYVLAGLSSAQHTWTCLSHQPPPTTSPSLPKPAISGTLAHAYNWTSAKNISSAEARNGGGVTGVVGGDEEEIYDEIDRVKTLHPVFVIPEGAPERTRRYFEARGSF